MWGVRRTAGQASSGSPAGGGSISRTSSTARRGRLALSALNAQLELLNPQRTLERGYAIVTDAKGTVLRTPKELHPRQVITLQLAEGSAKIGIDSVQPTFD